MCWRDFFVAPGKRQKLLAENERSTRSRARSHRLPETEGNQKDLKLSLAARLGVTIKDWPGGDAINKLDVLDADIFRNRMLML